MLIKVRCAQDIREGIEATYIRIDLWEIDLFRSGHPDFPVGPMEPGMWYGVAVPQSVMQDATVAEAPDGEPVHIEGGRVVSYMRRDLDRARLTRWEAGERFQATDLHREQSA